MSGQVNVQTDGMTYMALIMLPNPWPTRNHRLMCNEMDGRRVELWMTPERRFNGVLLEAESEDLIAECYTAEIAKLNPNLEYWTGVCISFCPVDRALTVRFFHKNHNRDGDAAVITFSGQEPRALTQADYTVNQQAIDRAVRKRSQLITKSELSKSSILQSKRWDALRREARILDEKLHQLQIGDSDYVGEVGISLRKLILSGNGNNLLFECAGLSNAPLIVWVSKVPDINDVPVKDGLTHFGISQRFSILPRVGYAIQTDLREWLSLPGCFVGLKPVSNRELLESIANKLGAHVDYDEGDSIASARRTRFNDKAEIERYLCNVGEGVVALANGLVAGKSQI